jgi:hypothetical protein
LVITISLFKKGIYKKKTQTRKRRRKTKQKRIKVGIYKVGLSHENVREKA